MGQDEGEEAGVIAAFWQIEDIYVAFTRVNMNVNIVI